MIQRVMTAEEFVLHRGELPDAGQWAELVRGVPVTLTPPDIDHGTIVLNLSKAFSSYIHASFNGYACFDLGLKVEARPDTVFFPAVSFFTQGERFAEADKDFTESPPVLVVELMTTKDRRQNISERVNAYLGHGVTVIWLVDPQQRTVHVVLAGQAAPRRLSERESLAGEPVLQGFQMPVAELFAVPDWAQGNR